MFFNKPKPKPVRNLTELKQDFRSALDKLIDEFEDAGLRLGEVQDLLKVKVERIDQAAAMSCVKRPYWHPLHGEPMPIPRTPDSVKQLADKIRGNK